MAFINYTTAHFSKCPDGDADSKLFLHLLTPHANNVTSSSFPTNTTYGRVTLYFYTRYEFVNMGSGNQEMYPASCYSDDGTSTYKDQTKARYQFPEKITNWSTNHILEYRPGDAGDIDQEVWAGESWMATPTSYSDCVENNWWRNGKRLSSYYITVRWYNGADNFVSESNADYDIRRMGTTSRGSNITTTKLLNGPTGDDVYSSSQSADLLGSNIATSSICTGDPHVTTFGGCKYTL